MDDASKDRTKSIVSLLHIKNLKVLKNNRNRGKGYSVKRGILEAKYSLVLFTDSDLPVATKYVKVFIEYINEGFDIVIASKYMKDASPDKKQSMYRKLTGKVFSLIVKLLVRGFNDTQCGFKLFKTNFAKQIANFQTCDGFAFDAEILYIAKKMGLKIKEVPVIWQNKAGSSVGIKDALQMFFDVLKIRFLNSFFGKYKIKP